MTDSEGYMSPPPRGRLEQMTRCYLGGGGGTKGALQEQQLSRQQSAKQFAEQMAFMKTQYNDAQNIKTPVLNPAQPAAMGSSDVYAQGVERRRRQASRFGSAATVLTPFAMGGATPLANAA